MTRSEPGQPRRARGTVGHAYSALNLRLVLAGFGLLSSAVLAALLFGTGNPVPGWFAIGLALIAVVDVLVVQRRRARRHRAQPGRRHSLFE